MIAPPRPAGQQAALPRPAPQKVGAAPPRPAPRKLTKSAGRRGAKLIVLKTRILGFDAL